MSLKPLQRLRNWISKPPYDGVPWFVWFYAVFCFTVCRHGGVFTGHLAGFDDHVRMVQVLEWINGHGWYDRTIMRANPPEGFATIWTRLVDIPIATVIILAQFFTDQRTAALVAAVVVPFVELGALFPVARYFARPLVGKDKAWLIVLFLMFTTVMNYQIFSIGGFHPGEASHHPWYTILNLAIFGAAARIALGARGRSPIFIMGGSIALVLAVGIESLPMIAVAAALLAFAAWLDSRPQVARRGAQAVGLGALGGLILLPMNQPPANLFDISFVEPSVLGPILVFTAAAFLAASHLAIQAFGRKKIPAFIAMALAGLALLAGMIAAFPEILNGPLAGLSPAERHMALTTHFEMLPLYRVCQSFFTYAGLTVPSLIALGAGAAAIYAAGNARRRGMSIIYLGFALFSGAMAQRYSRYIHHALTSACVWLLWLWEKVKERLPRNRNYMLAVVASFIAIGPFWLLLLPALAEDAPILTQVVLYPSKIQSVQDACDPLPVAEYINDHFSKDSVLIVPDWDSSRFLYFTDVVINFVANYPSQDKFIDNDNFFATHNPEMARDIAVRHHIDLVAACHYPLLASEHHPLNDQPLIGLLQIGRPPKWLKYVDTRAMGNYVLYEVDKKALND